MVWWPLTSSKIRANIQQNLHCNCRAKMAASFKLPCLVKKRKPPVNFPLLEWRDISIKEQLGSGTFGSVYLVNYEKEEQNVIVKKMKESRPRLNTSSICHHWVIPKYSYLLSWHGSSFRFKKSVRALSENEIPDRSNSSEYGWVRFGLIMANIISPIKDQMSAFFRSSWPAKRRFSE